MEGRDVVEGGGKGDVEGRDGVGEWLDDGTGLVDKKKEKEGMEDLVHRVNSGRVDGTIIDTPETHSQHIGTSAG